MQYLIPLFLSQVALSRAFFVQTHLSHLGKHGISTPHHAIDSKLCYKTVNTTDPVTKSNPPLFQNIDFDDYAEFLDKKDRRLALQQCSTFDALDPIDVERLVHIMKRIPVEPGHKVLTQGDKADDGVFFVASGTFECYDEPTGSVKATLHQYDVFGELALLLNQKRALSVRASSPAASVWNIGAKDFVQVVSGNTKMAAVEALDNQETYADFLEQRSRLKILRSCPIMKNLADSDTNAVLRVMKKVEVSEGEVIIEQGSDGDSMYFVVDGEFECFQQDNGKVLKVCGKGDYFGELALFFQTPRKLSVKATKPSTVLELSREDFFNAVEETSIDREALEVLRNAYHTQGYVNLDELYQLLVVKSRPAKKPVSFHSTFSIFSAGVFVSAFLPFFSPGLDERGIPMIFRVADHIDPAASLQMQVACWLFGVSGLLGLFRFPPNAPPSRKLIFEAAVSTNLFLAAYGSSSLNGQAADGWWFDAFTIPGTIALFALGFLMNFSALRILDDAIAGQSRGRDTISGADTPAMAIPVYSALCALVLLAFAPILPVLTSDAASYEESVTNIFIENGIDGILVAVASCATGLGAFGSLLSTLQFEKKITPVVGNVLVLILLVVMNFDQVVFTFNSLTRPEVYAPNLDVMNDYFYAQSTQAHLFGLVGVILSGVVLNALRKRFANQEADII